MFLLSLRDGLFTRHLTWPEQCFPVPTAYSWEPGRDAPTWWEGLCRWDHLKAPPEVGDVTGLSGAPVSTQGSL